MMLYIKNEFIEAIKSKSKTKEYRSLTPRYRSLLDYRGKTLMLKSGRKNLKVLVDSVKIIECPGFLNGLGINFTKDVLEISISEIISANW